MHLSSPDQFDRAKQLQIQIDAVQIEQRKVIECEGVGDHFHSLQAQLAEHRAAQEALDVEEERIGELRRSILDGYFDEDIEEQCEVIEHDWFMTSVNEMLTNITQQYAWDVVCHGSQEAYDAYATAVSQYQTAGKLKKLFSKNPEVTHVPIGYHIAKVIEIFEKARQDHSRPVRVLYPGAGGDVAQFLQHVHLLKDKDIELVFVDPGESQTGTPTSTIIPRLKKVAPGISVENHQSDLAAFVEQNDKPIDIFLYHTPSLSRTLSIGPAIFKDVDMKALRDQMSENAVMLGDNRDIDHMLQGHERAFFEETFEQPRTADGFPLSVKKHTPLVQAKAA